MKGKLRVSKDGSASVDDATPKYKHTSSKYVGPEFFSIKLFYGGEFDDLFKNYIGGDVTYFDNISRENLSLSGLKELLQEIGLENGSFDIWLHLPETNLQSTSLIALETDLCVQAFGDLVDDYSTLLNLYTTNSYEGPDYDFSFTQFELGERERRVDEIREECEKNDEEIMEEQMPGEINEEDILEFYGDTSNKDSTETEAPPPRRKKKIPPSNPPYRTRKRGRHSMLRVPVATQPSQKDLITEVKKTLENDCTVEIGNGFAEDTQNDFDDDLQTADEKRGESDSEDSESMYDSSDERMAVSSCDEMDSQYPEFNELTNMKDPQFELGMLFSSGKIFRAAVRKHAIVHQRPIRLRKNLADKIKWICADGCQWKCYGIKQQRSSNIQIKTLYTKHTCNPTWEQKQVNSRWIAEAYEDQIRMNPTWKLESFHHQVINDLRCQVSYSMIYRAMRKAREAILGKHEKEYKKLYNYGNELMKAMPTSIVKLMTEAAECGVEGRRFKRFYICLGPLKAGFMSGCRPLIGLNGCHLKGPFKGILLTAVVTDPNDGMYPMAWAQVEAENNQSWDWFLSLLKVDLMIENDGAYTFISDRQKGLVNALEANFPSAEKRFCVMHLYINLWKEYKGIGIRRELWSAAKSTTDYFFNMHMENLKRLNLKAYKWLDDKPKSQWSRSSFREICKSDTLVNNQCEIFNNAINYFREMGIITMFKNMHTTCMQRIQRRKSKMEARKTIFCTKALKKLEKAMEKAINARPVWSGGDKFHVTMTSGGHEIVVDIKNHQCACKKWQLTGIPCFHACACIFFRKESPIDYIHECYKRSQYLNVYNHILEPINGEEFWDQVEESPPLPPLVKVAPGRPKKNRNKRSDVVETRKNDPTMLKRKGTSLKCANCKEYDHNIRTCQKKKIDKDSEEVGQVKKPAKCNYCKEEGHNSRTCKAKEVDLETKKKEEARKKEEEVRKKEETIKKIGQDKGKGIAIHIPASHGGVMKQFKAPVKMGPLGVEAESYVGNEGQHLTSMRKLDQARLKKQKLIGKKA